MWTHTPAKTNLAMHDGANQIQHKSGMLARKLFATLLAGSHVFITLPVENRVLAKILLLSGKWLKINYESLEIIT